MNKPNDTAMDHFKSAYRNLRDNAKLTDEMIEQSSCYLAAELTLIQEKLEAALLLSREVSKKGRDDRC